MQDRVDRIISRIRAIHEEVSHRAGLVSLPFRLTCPGHQCMKRPDRDGTAQDIVIVSHGALL